jgi:hypothetical protein
LRSTEVEESTVVGKSIDLVICKLGLPNNVSVLQILLPIPPNPKGKKSTLPPQTMRVGTHHPPPYENGFFTPLKFIKQDNSPPEAILKIIVNHRKIIK